MTIKKFLLYYGCLKKAECWNNLIYVILGITWFISNKSKDNRHLMATFTDLATWYSCFDFTIVTLMIFISTLHEASLIILTLLPHNQTILCARCFTQCMILSGYSKLYWNVKYHRHNDICFSLQIFIGIELHLIYLTKSLYFWS